MPSPFEPRAPVVEPEPTSYRPPPPTRRRRFRGIRRWFRTSPTSQIVSTFAVVFAVLVVLGVLVAVGLSGALSG